MKQPDKTPSFKKSDGVFIFGVDEKYIRRLGLRKKVKTWGR